MITDTDIAPLAPAERVELHRIEVSGAYIIDVTAIGTLTGTNRYCVGIVCIDPVTMLGVSARHISEHEHEHQAHRAADRLHEIICHAVMAWPRV